MDDQRAQPPAAMRASDADRESYAQILHAAAADGRLSMPEMEERLRDVYRSKTLAELRPLTEDLVPQPAAPVFYEAVTPPTGERSGAWAFAMMSELSRTGEWVVPAHFSVGAVMGSATLDLRFAFFEQPRITIAAYAFWGGVEIIVPDDVDVVVQAVGVLGGVVNRAKSEPAERTATRRQVRVTGAAIMGGIEIRRATKKERRKAVEKD